MRIRTAAFLLAAAHLVSALPVRNVSSYDNMPHGMPYPSDKQLKMIEEYAHGTLPNGPPPPGISEPGITNLKLVAFNELFEVAFFNELITNITEKVPGYRFSSEDDLDYVLRSLRTILAQEELHALDANNALDNVGIEPIEPCHYKFPVDNFDAAILLASTFTDVVLGTLQDVVERFAMNGDFGLSREVSSIVGQEGEQQGWFRIMQGKVPSELPFLTTSDLNFAFTAIQSFVVPGTCPNIDSIPLKTFQPLDIITTPTARTANISFAFAHSHHTNDTRLWMTYINQQNLPIVEPLQVVENEGDDIVAKALFPYDTHEMNGLTIAAVTPTKGPFPNAWSVANETLAGPGLIIVN
ncbi:uncharacterized protein N7515_009243 [Penicillium bovifimosum]|uniref:Sexual development protein n=1 Tax=Penicillium bovifimosum TaxID=126998 RepID=A0A9W9KVB8_9EURO|nr:uncharacterized protein N7515_009243 [Penicillium bovifimosum]KAJ5121282.1 hypothetical protein N7515_009243 [Penicillium bovifimosum]